MKICWDNIEGLKYNPKSGTWSRNGAGRWLYAESCLWCKEPFITQINREGEGRFCTKSCSLSFKNSNTDRSGKNNPFYGRKHKKESIESMKKRLSEILSGENNPFYGRKHTEETKDKISKSRIGKTAGSKNPGWRGGISKYPYCDVFRDREWRNIIHERDKDRRCWNPFCDNNNDKKECFHHIDYDKQNCHPSNIIKICNTCNVRANGDREWWTSFYNEVMRRRGYAVK